MKSTVERCLINFQSMKCNWAPLQNAGIWIWAILLVLATGCATSSKNLTRLSIGMTKAEVVGILGEPTSVRAKGSTELMIYNLHERTTVRRDFFGQGYLNHESGEYFIKLVEGRVEAYGKPGDFGDTTIQPKDEKTLNIKIQ